MHIQSNPFVFNCMEQYFQINEISTATCNGKNDLREIFFLPSATFLEGI